MLFNYLKFAIRNLRRKWTYSSLNIIGMGIGFAAGLMLLFWVQQERSFDRFHHLGAKIYRINAHIEDLPTWTGVPYPLASVARENLPEVGMAVRIMPAFETSLFKVGEKRFFEDKYALVDSTFFQLFNFQLEKGNANRPFTDARSILISKKIANKFFGLENPMGKIIQFDSIPVTVSGVMEDFPNNSTYQFDIILNIQLLTYISTQFPKAHVILPMNDWSNYNYETLIYVQPNTSLRSVSEKFNEILYRNKPNLEAGSVHFTLQPLLDIHLYNPDGNPRQIKTVNLFWGIALLILFLAAINYINIALALAAQRIKEIGIRKVTGANKIQLMTQFWLETAVLLIGSSAVGFMLMTLGEPIYQQITGLDFQLEMLHSATWRLIGMTFLGVWITTAIYPAMILSSLRIAHSLKGQWKIGRLALLKKGLIVAQFGIAVILLMVTMVIGRQLNFLLTSDLGFKTDHVFEIPIRQFTMDYKSMKSELSSIPGISEVSGANGTLFDRISATSNINWPGKPKDLEIMIDQIGIDPNFIQFFQIPLIAGRGFGADDESGPTQEVVINEQAVKLFNLSDPIGETVEFQGKPVSIIGVAKDIHLASLHNTIEPAIYYKSSKFIKSVYVRTLDRNVDQVLKSIKEYWDKFQPEFPFKYTFLSDQYAHQYTREKNAKKLFGAFGFIAFIISCLGLFGLSMHAAELRIKEVGIRKVMGSSEVEIIKLISRDFMVLVGGAVILAIPVTITIMHYWLQDYAYHISMPWVLLLLIGTFAILIALLTVSIQSYNAARINPVKVLRNE